MQTEWCRVCNLYAGNKYGTFFHPEKDDEVLVAFVQGDMRQPVVLGGLYNGQDKPPTARTQDKDEKVIRTKAGHQITLDDTRGSEKIVIVDKTGKNSVVIDANANSITVTAQGKLVLNGKGVEIKSGAEMKIEATGTLDVKGATINLN
jgi:phage baseplate assembly protein V